MLGGIYPFGSESFLTEDLKYQYIDFFTWYKQVLAGQTSIFYSLAQGLGSNTWGLYSYYLASPFNLLLVFFPEGQLTMGIFIVCALKLGCISAAMAFFVRRRFDVGYGAAFILALCFAGSTWVLTNVRNPLWLDAVILLPLLSWAAYCFIRKGSWKLFVLLITIDVICCWYMAYMTLLFLALYLIFELYLLHVESSVDARFIAKRVVCFVGVLVLALALSAWTFLPTVMAMSGGSSSGSMFLVRFTCWPLSLIQGLLPGMWVSGSSPQLYCGLISLALAAVFFIGKVPRRVKLAAACMLLVLLASVCVGPLQYVWCGFRNPNGFYSRVALFFTFFLIWVAAYGWQVLTASARVQALSPAVRKGVLCIVAVAVFCELAVSGHLAWNQLYTGYSQDQHDSYVEESAQQLDELQAYDSSIYRFEKTYTRVTQAAQNEGLAQGFSQLSSYSSAQNYAAIDFLNRMGYSGVGQFWCAYTDSSLLGDSLLGVKYVSSDMPLVGMKTTGVEQPSRGAQVYQNASVLSVGYGVSSAVLDAQLPDSDTASANPFEYQNAVVSALLGQEVEAYKPMNATQVSAGDTPTWQVEVPANAVGYAYVAASESWGSTLTIDGVASDDNNRFRHAMRSLGDVQGSVRTVEVSLAGSEAAALPEDATCLFYYLDMDVFNQVIEQLSQHQFQATTFEGNQINGTYSAAEDGLMLITVPYDKGWTVYVNGQGVSVESVFHGALMAIPVTAGENSIEMSYLSPGFIPGCVISAIALIGFGIACFVRRKKAA